MRLIHSGASEEAVVWVRRLLFGICFLIAAFDPIERLALLPAAVFKPPCPLFLLPWESQIALVTSWDALVVVRILTAGATLLAFLGIGFLWSGPLAILLFCCHQAIGRSLGFMYHAEVPLILSAGVFVLLYVVGHFSRRKTRPEEILVATTTIFLLPYVTIALYRLANGFPDVFLEPKMEAWAVEQGSRIGYFTFGWGRYVPDYPVLAAFLRGGFIIGTILEMGALFALVFRPFRLAFIAFMLPMHFFILLFMNIAFLESMVLFLLLMDMGTIRHKNPCFVLFDGVCNFCNGFVRFLQKRDPQRTLYFVASQSDAGRALMEQYRISEADVSTTIYAIEGNQVSSKSTAVSRITRRLALPWRLVSEIALVPAPLRDPFYRLFSTNRYRWFGKGTECALPTPEERSRYPQTAADLATALREVEAAAEKPGLPQSEPERIGA